MTDLTLALKPGADHGRLVTLARDLAAAVRRQSPREMRDLLAEAEHAAAEVFLDPSIAGSLQGDAREFDDLVASADRVTSLVQRLEHHAPSDVLTLTSWPDMIRGGERLLHYRLVRPLGGGGMGRVYLAWDERLDRHVALKRLADTHDGASGYRRLEREARASARLRHEHVVMIFTVEYLGDEPVLVQEYVEGVDLADRLGKLQLSEALAIAIQIASGLAAAHAAGILHRDLKPNNIRLRPDGTALILDFGLGKAFIANPEDQTQVALTEDGTVLGTPAYMSPDQLRGLVLTPASDVFSLGVLLYELFAGRRPFDGSTRAALAAAILHDEPNAIEDSGLPPHVQQLVLACLQKDPTTRPSAALVFEELLGATVAPDAGTPNVRFLVPRDSDALIVTAEEPETKWAVAQRERARNTVDPSAVAYEFRLSFDHGGGEVPIGQMKELLRSVQLPNSESCIGRVVEDDRHRLQRGTNEVYATFLFAAQRAYWAAAHDGEFYYVTSIPLVERGGIALEFILGETFDALDYAARYSERFARLRGARVTISVEIRNATGRPLVGTDWSHRFPASLDAMQKRAENAVRSSLRVTVPSLRAQLHSCTRLLFDDLMVYFDFLTVPADYYQHVFRRIRTTDT